MLDNQLFGRFETFQIVNYQAFRMFILLHSAVSHMEVSTKNESIKY